LGSAPIANPPHLAKREGLGFPDSGDPAQGFIIEVMRPAHVARGVSLALLAAAGGCNSGLGPSGPDLSGRWRGQAEIGMGLATILDMTLQDQGGSITGSGGGADCRYFVYCSSFGTYTVTGTHDETRIRLNGVSIYGPTWTLEGRLDGETASGPVAGTDIPSGNWQMTRVP
jgi:hypothetical protein